MNIETVVLLALVFLIAVSGLGHALNALEQRKIGCNWCGAVRAGGKPWTRKRRLVSEMGRVHVVCDRCDPYIMGGDTVKVLKV